MNYGYVRVSSDKQTVENQKYEIKKFCQSENVTIDGWIEESVSGTCEYKKRKLGKLLSQVHKDDIIICSEISRLGRSLYMIMEILNVCMERECKVWTVKDGFRLGDDIQSKVLAFAFGLSAEIERQLISQRTKEALNRKRAEGVKLGRPVGAKRDNSKLKLHQHHSSVMSMHASGSSIYAIAKRFKVSTHTVKLYLQRMLHDETIVQKSTV